MALDEHGEPFVAWEKDTNSDPFVVVNRFDGTEWSELSAFSGPSVAPGADPSVAVKNGMLCVARRQDNPTGVLLRCMDN